MIWALKHAPDVPPQCVSALMGLADAADKQGRGAYIGQKLLAEYARKTDRQVRSDLTRLQDLEIIRRGDQSLAAHIPADCRPVVYDLALERKRTSARQSASARNQTSPATDEQPSDLLESGGTGSVLPGGSETSRERKPASYKPTDNPKTKKTSRAPRRNLNAGREDVERLCAHLADRIQANDPDGKRPNIGQQWRDAARLMLDTDDRKEERIHRAIDWCQNSEFWRRNIHSMPKLRDKYARLAQEADDERKRLANGHGPRQPRSANPDRPDHMVRR